ncbi:hypothetical protein LY76DRAFT_11313 [Colletotrichum caudatum]|nr:hypothetical protein LY76DRAFT_11313 [Colletotrichum caudatum]
MRCHPSSMPLGAAGIQYGYVWTATYLRCYSTQFERTYMRVYHHLPCNLVATRHAPLPKREPLQLKPYPSKERGGRKRKSPKSDLVDQPSVPGNAGLRGYCTWYPANHRPCLAAHHANHANLTEPNIDFVLPPASHTTHACHAMRRRATQTRVRKTLTAFTNY